MTPDQEKIIRQLRDTGRSLLYISACVDGVTYREIETLLGPEPMQPARMSPALHSWWMQQPWVWRPDNPAPIEAPWERLTP
jgi:hypothetical protein